MPFKEKMHSHQRRYVELLKSRTLFLWLLIVVVYVGIRIQKFRHVSIFEDHDSVALLLWTKQIYEQGFSGLLALDPDASVAFSFFASLIAQFGLDLEASARLVSLLSALVLLIMVALIGYVGGLAAGCLLTVALLALNPSIVFLSAAILTEPLFVATVYCGLLLFLKDASDPSLMRAAMLGLIMGVAFLNRLEALVLVVFFPIMLFIRQLFAPRPTMSMRHLLPWVVIFVLAFATLAVPQVLRVSEEMGAFAVNGRAAWTLLLHSPEAGLSYLEKIRGLYFHPGVVNIVYLKSNFSAASALTGNTAAAQDLILGYAQTVARNLLDLPFKLWVMLGPLVLVSAAAGLGALWESGRRFEVVFFSAFVGFCLIAPLLHNVVVRHIVIIAPIITLLSGLGVRALWVNTDGLLAKFSLRSRRLFVTVACAITTLLWAPLLAAELFLSEYSANSMNENGSALRNSRAELQEVKDAVREFAESHGIQQPRLVAAKRYLSWYAGLESSSISAPYTDLPGLIRYCELNKADLLFVDYELRNYPFLQPLLDDPETHGFSPLYEGVTVSGSPVALYQINSERWRDP